MFQSKNPYIFTSDSSFSCFNNQTKLVVTQKTMPQKYRKPVERIICITKSADNQMFSTMINTNAFKSKYIYSNIQSILSIAKFLPPPTLIKCSFFKNKHQIYTQVNITTSEKRENCVVTWQSHKGVSLAKVVDTKVPRL